MFCSFLIANTTTHNDDVESLQWFRLPFNQGPRSVSRTLLTTLRLPPPLSPASLADTDTNSTALSLPLRSQQPPSTPPLVHLSPSSLHHFILSGLRLLHTPPPTMSELKDDPLFKAMEQRQEVMTESFHQMSAQMAHVLAAIQSLQPAAVAPAAPAVYTHDRPADTPPTRPPLRTPLSRSSIGEVRDVEPRLPPARRLGFQEPQVAPLAPSSLLASPLHEAEAHPPTTRYRSLKVNIPKPFTGSTTERANAKLWLESVIVWMELTAEGSSEKTLIALFSTALADGALQWFHNFRKKGEAENRAYSLQDYFDQFIRTYDGALSDMVAEQQLKALIYKKGVCKDLTATEQEFDRLANRLYPTAQTSKDTNRLLANHYGDTILRGDIELWGKAMSAQPITLDEWKAAVQNAHLIIETKKAHVREAQRVDRSEVRTTYYSRPSSSSSTSFPRRSNAVQVKKVAVDGDDDHDDHVTRDEPGHEEEVQKAEVSRPSAFRPAGHERLGSHLTFQQRERLKELGKCWICIGKGHRAYECEKKGKAGYPRKLSAEDLKA